ncbi:MAG: dCMP deaminase family protein [Candidatus Wildermuthbacteria bacterium]|nr:dCMP deaminase family protein [Candidatus Wildermuthbacteria bacterium]
MWRPQNAPLREPQKAWALRSSSPKRHVGSVIVKNRRILATGFNGAPSGLPHCTETGCLAFEGEGTSCKRVVHSEHNAILQDSGNLSGATLYTSYFPCHDCMKAIVSAKIKEIVYEQEYSKHKEKYGASLELAKQAGVSVRKISSVDVAGYLSAHYGRTR